MRCKGAKGGKVVRWQGGRFLVFFKGWGCRVKTRFHLFVPDINETKEQDVFKIFLRSRSDGKTLPRSNVSCSKCSPV